MRVVIVTKSFFGGVNGVTNTVRRAVDELVAEHHTALLTRPENDLAV